MALSLAKSDKEENINSIMHWMGLNWIRLRRSERAGLEAGGIGYIHIAPDYMERPCGPIQRYYQK